MEKHKFKRRVLSIMHSSVNNSRLDTAAMRCILNISNRKYSTARKCVCFILILVNVSICAYQVGSQIYRYLQFPLHVDVTDDDTQQFTLPEIYFSGHSDAYLKYLEKEKMPMLLCFNPLLGFSSLEPSRHLSELLENFNPNPAVKYTNVFTTTTDIKNLSLENIDLTFGRCLKISHSKKFNVVDRPEIKIKFMVSENRVCGLPIGVVSIPERNRIAWNLMDYIMIYLHQQSRIFYTISNYENLNSPANPCVSSLDFYKCEKKCLINELRNLKNKQCKMKLIENHDLSNCDSGNETLRETVICLNNVLNKINPAIKCNCPRRCHNIFYSIFIATDFVSTSESLSILLALPTIHVVTERYAYSVTSLLCDAGGNLGLYLGICCLSAIDLIVSLIKEKINLNIKDPLHAKIRRIYLRHVGNHNLQSFEIPGMNYITKGNRRIKRVVWVCILITASIACGCQLINRMNYYFSYPTYTTVEIKNDIIIKIPDAVFCIQGYRFKSFIKKTILSVETRFSVDQCKEVDIYDLIDYVPADTIWEKMELSNDFVDTRKIFESLFGIRLSPQNWTHNYPTVFGMCSLLQRDTEEYQSGYSRHLATSQQKSSFCPFCKYQIFLVPYNDYFDVKQQMRVECGVEVGILLRRKSIVRLNTPIKPCDSAKKVADCLHDCKQRVFEKLINCSLPFMKNSTLGICNSTTSSKAVRSAYFYAYGSEEAVKKCKCLPKCEEDIFLALTNAGLKSVTGDTVVVIRLETNMREVMAENRAFTTTDLFCNFGSSLGMILGLSMFGMIEILQFLCPQSHKL